jgi:hypothetical protein
MVVPSDPPVSRPVPAPIVATAVVPLTHVPPPTPSLSIVVVPAHSACTPPGADGDGYTVATRVTTQLDPKV